MDPKARLRFSLIATVSVAVISLAVAYMCFRIMDSSAEGTLKQWRFGGAFAGFVFTASLLTSISLQFYKQMTSETIDACRALIAELQAKLIKGAPCPDDFSIDIDERNKLVFARPERWLPRGGLLYQYVEPPKPSDAFNANFNVVYMPESELQKAMEGQQNPAEVDLEKLYERVAAAGVLVGAQSVSGYETVGFSQEYVQVDGLKSLKIIHTFRMDSPVPGTEETKLEVCQSSVLTYVPRRKALFQFTFSDNSEDYLVSSEVFSQVTSSIRFLE